jgi:hypothetical protein
MTHTVMAADAVKVTIVVHPVRGYVTNKFLVAKQAIPVQYLGIPGFDTDRILKIPKSECDGMMIAIARFRHPLGDKILRHMAIVTGSEGVMAGFFPAVKLFAHDVAVHACLRIIKKVGCGTPIIEGIPACTQENPNQRIEQQFHSECAINSAEFGA